MERGRWKLVSRTSTTANSNPGRMNRSLCPSSAPVAAAVSRARTVVVPTATTRAARRQALQVAAGTR